MSRRGGVCLTPTPLFPRAVHDIPLWVYISGIYTNAHRPTVCTCDTNALLDRAGYPPVVATQVHPETHTSADRWGMRIPGRPL